MVSPVSSHLYFKENPILHALLKGVQMGTAGVVPLPIMTKIPNTVSVPTETQLSMAETQQETLAFFPLHSWGKPSMSAPPKAERMGRSGVPLPPAMIATGNGASAQTEVTAFSWWQHMNLDTH